MARSGEVQSITWTVPVDAGNVLLGCHISDHDERGMAGLVHPVGPGGVPLASSSPVSSPASSSTPSPVS